MPDIADLIERVSCCAPSDLFKSAGSGSKKMRATAFEGKLDISALDRVIKRDIGNGSDSGNHGRSSAGQLRRNRCSENIHQSHFSQALTGRINIHQGRTHLLFSYHHLDLALAGTRILGRAEIV